MRPLVHGAALALALLSGCSLILDVPDETTNRCAGDGECSSGVCDVELGMCVTEPEEQYRFVVSVALPADELAGRPAQVAEAGQYLTIGTADVQVSEPVPLAGTVRAESRRVDADLVFTRVDERASLPAAPIVVSTTPDDSAATDFRTELVPGHYAVEIVPRGTDVASYPPYRTEIDADSGRTFDVILPALGEYTLLEGTIVDASGMPLDLLEVRAIERATGRRVSSIATTSPRSRAGAGGFALRIAPGAGPWVLEVSAPDALQALAAFPTIVIHPSVLVRDPDDLVHLLVPSPDTGRCIAGSVELPGGGMSPAVGASVTLRSNELRDMETGIAGQFLVQMTTSTGAAAEPSGCSGVPLAPGGFEGRILPGTYDVEIRPLEDEAGIFVGQIVVGDEDHLGQIFELPARTVVGGTVQRTIDQTLADARVRALALHAPLPYERMRVEALLNRPNDTLTDATGRFSLPLDVGVYDLVVEPPADSNYPWLVRPDYGIGGSTAAVTEVFDVRTPVVVRGMATFGDGTTIAGAQIDAFALVGAEGTERPVPIGRATTEADGTFLLLLPPAIATAR